MLLQHRPWLSGIDQCLYLNRIIHNLFCQGYLLWYSTMIADLCEKSCKKPVEERKEMEKKPVEERKETEKKKDSLHDETSADVDAEEASTKRQLPNYFIAIQVRNPEVQFTSCSSVKSVFNCNYHIEIYCFFHICYSIFVISVCLCTYLTPFYGQVYACSIKCFISETSQQNYMICVFESCQILVTY